MLEIEECTFNQNLKSFYTTFIIGMWKSIFNETIYIAGSLNLLYKYYWPAFLSDHSQ